MHGKGIGNIRRSVHAILERVNFVDSYRLAPEQMGGWGATLVWLKRPSSQVEPPGGEPIVEC